MTANDNALIKNKKKFFEILNILKPAKLDIKKDKKVINAYCLLFIR